MRHFVSTDGAQGAALLRCALAAFPNDEYDIVAGTRSRAKIEAVAGAKRPVLSLDERVMTELQGRPDGYYDWFLNLWGGHVFAPQLLRKARRSLNVHPSLLPHGRGRDPVVWAVYEGAPAGVTLHEMTGPVDAGAIWYQEPVGYQPHETGGAVYSRVIDACMRVFAEQWPVLRQTTRSAQAQPDGNWPTRRRRDLEALRCRRIDSDVASAEIVRWLLAYDFGPSFRAQVELQGQIYDACLTLTPAKLPTP